MTVFVDTSALFALLDEDDANHGAARSTFVRLKGTDLVTHAYVIVETVALVSRRLGWRATERFLDGILPVIRVVPVDEATHSTALLAYRVAGSTAVSLVDRTSFAVMRADGIDRAFAFDRDFDLEGLQPA
jgi:predicted nucleic acid-binding protein